MHESDDPSTDMPPLEVPLKEVPPPLEDPLIRLTSESMEVNISASETNDISEPDVLDHLLYQKSNDDVEVPPIVRRLTDFHANEADFDSPPYVCPTVTPVVTPADRLPYPPLNPPPGYFHEDDFVTGPEEYSLQWSNGQDIGCIMQMHQDEMEIMLVDQAIAQELVLFASF